MIKAKLTMLEAIFSEVLLLFTSFVPCYTMTVSVIYPLDILLHGVRYYFGEPLGIDLTKTLDFTLSFKRQPSTCFKMGTRTVRVFFLGTFMDFELFEGSLCGVALFFVVVVVVAVIRYCLQIITPSL